VSDTSAKFTYTRTLIGAERLEDGTWLVQNHLEGDFPAEWWICATGSSCPAH